MGSNSARKRRAGDSPDGTGSSRKKPREISGKPKFGALNLEEAQKGMKDRKAYRVPDAGRTIDLCLECGLEDRKLEIVDYKQVRKWMKICERDHGSECRPTDEFPPEPGIEVIDCKKKKVVPLLASMEYVALSYVWGNKTCNREDLETGHLPATIEDAIKVTLELGEQFLWVDQLCVKDEVRPATIKLMGSIYKSASLTIIAAAGEDSGFGLPGVSRPFEINIKRTLGCGCQEYSLPSPKEESLNSIWNTRGWTHQEGLLSPRRLLFLPSQVYFQCLRMFCYEDWKVEPETFYWKNTKRFREQRGLLTLQVFPRWGFGKGPGEVCDRINEFVPRTLGCKSDSLPAMLGIFGEFRRLEPNQRVYHFYGVPIPFEMPDLKGEKTLQNVELGSHFCKAFIRSLLWDTCSPDHKHQWGGLSRVLREGHSNDTDYAFPSWSWAGWWGEWKVDPYAKSLEFDRWNRTYRDQVDAEVTFRKREEGNVKVEVADYVNSGGQYDDFLPELHMTCWWSIVRFQQAIDGRFIVVTGVGSGDSPREEAYCFLDMKAADFAASKLLEQSWNIAVVSWTVDSPKIPIPSIALLLQKRNDDEYSRMGLVRGQWRNPQIERPRLRDSTESGGITFFRKKLMLV